MRHFGLHLAAMAMMVASGPAAPPLIVRSRERAVAAGDGGSGASTRTWPSPLDAACPRCRAEPGVECDPRSRSRRRPYHLARVQTFGDPDDLRQDPSWLALVGLEVAICRRTDCGGQQVLVVPGEPLP